MPDLHSSAAPAGDPPSAARAAPGFEDSDDFALGCECADPALQIERWGQETAAPGKAHAEAH